MGSGAVIAVTQANADTFVADTCFAVGDSAQIAGCRNSEEHFVASSSLVRIVGAFDSTEAGFGGANFDIHFGKLIVETFEPVKREGDLSDELSDSCFKV